MAEKIHEMSYKEAWEKLQADYLVSLGVIFKFIKDRFGEQALVDFENSEVERYKSHLHGFAARLATALEKVAPGLVFKEKMREVAREFQWFLGVGNMRIVELNSDHALAELKCPFEQALKSSPTDLGFGRELYCKYQCNTYASGVCKHVLGFELVCEPQPEGRCLYKARRLEVAR